MNFIPQFMQNLLTPQELVLMSEIARNAERIRALFADLAPLPPIQPTEILPSRPANFTVLVPPVQTETEKPDKKRPPMFTLNLPSTTAVQTQPAKRPRLNIPTTRPTKRMRYKKTCSRCATPLLLFDPDQPEPTCAECEAKHCDFCCQFTKIALIIPISDGQSQSSVTKWYCANCDPLDWFLSS